MSIIEKLDSKDIIRIQHFNVCKVDGITMDEIRKLYTCRDIGKKCAVYKIDKFIHHLKYKHNLNLIDYCEKFLGCEWKKCPITGLKVNYRRRNKDYIELNKYHDSAILTKENSQLVRDYCDKFSRERRGKNNPMYGLKPWNKGLGLEHPSIKATADKWRGTKMSESAKEKMKQRRAENPLKARHTQPHSNETKEFLRKHTAKLWASGVFSKTTSIHIKMREFLTELKLKELPQEEHQIDYYSVDFAFVKSKIAIECDGDYYHVNPMFYPNGPEDAIQRRNYGRDKRKNEWLKQKEWVVIRFWECEINAGSYKEKLKCKLKELNLLEE